MYNMQYIPEVSLLIFRAMLLWVLTVLMFQLLHV